MLQGLASFARVAWFDKEERASRQGKQAAHIGREDGRFAGRNGRGGFLGGRRYSHK